MAKDRYRKSLLHQVVPLTLRKGDIRKIQIIEAAIRSLASDGLRNVTFQTVATHSKLAVAHVAYHFPALNDLLFAAIKYVYASLHAHITDALASDPTPSEILKVYLDAHLEWLEVNPHYPSAGLALINLSCSDPRYRALHSEMKEVGQKRIEAILSLSAKAAKKKKSPADLRELAHLLQSLLMGQIVFFQSTTHTRTIAAMKKATHRQVLALLESF